MNDVSTDELERVLLTCLQNTLSSDQNIRELAEQDLKNLEVSEGLGVGLCSITLNLSIDDSIRQLSSVILKRYTELHWSSSSEKFQQPEVSLSSKAVIRELLLQALVDSSSKVRSCVAYVIAAIAHWDWPETWPNLVPALLDNLSSGRTALVHGSIRVFVELARDISEAQIQEVLPSLLPKLHEIFIHSDVYTSHTRSHSINILTTFIQLIHTISKEYPDAPHKILFPILPSFLEGFFHFLSSSAKLFCDFSLQKEVYNCIVELLKAFPKLVFPLFDKIFPVFWMCFVQSTQSYLTKVVFSSEEGDDEVDSDGNQISLDSILFVQFSIWNTIIIQKRFHVILKSYLPDLILHLISLAQVTEDTYQSWQLSISQLVDDEESVLSSYSVRICALDVIRLLEEEQSLADCFNTAMHSGIAKHILLAKEARQVDNCNWWKILEASMLVYRHIISYCQEMQDYDINSIITEILLPCLSSDQPLLISRAIWLAGHMIPLLPIDYIKQFVELTAKGLSAEQHIFIRVFSTLAMYQYANAFRSHLNQSIITPFIPSVIQCLGDLANVCLDEGDVLTDILEALNQCLHYEVAFVEAVDGQIIPLIASAFTKYYNDPHLGTVVEETFTLLANNPLFLKLLQEKFIPDSIKVISSTQNEFPTSMISATMDILSKIIRASVAPLLVYFFDTVFTTLVLTTLRSDDNSILQSGGECLRAFLASDAEGLISWHDQDGTLGLNYIIKVIEHLLDPKNSEFSAVYVGKLINLLIKKASAVLGELLNVILRAVISKLNVSNTPTVIQSLILVFASLIQTQLEYVLEFLSSLPSSTGKPALNQVMSDWVQLQSTIFGSYDTRLSIMALSKVLTYGVTSQDPKLGCILVRGDEIFQSDIGIQTRSKTRSRPKQYTEVPLLAKIFKVIVQELGVSLESHEVGILGSARGLDEDSGDDDDEDYDDNDEDDDRKGSLSGDDLVEDVLLHGSRILSLDDFEEDPDVLNEELTKLDLRMYLTDYCTQFCQLPGFINLLPMLTEKEIQTIQDAGIKLPL